MTPVALSTPATIALVAAILVGLGFVAWLVALAIRRRGDQGPDIPAGMRPGPADEVLERRHVERAMGWGILFVAVIALSVMWVWLREPDQNVDDAFELVSRSTERGEMWFEVASEENPTGFGCARCHGENAEGGSVPFTTPTGEFIEAYPVPPLRNVCGGPTTGHPQIQEFEDIITTIEQGREGTPMPSWSVSYAGPMNDQQIQDLINYLISIQEGVAPENNLCTSASAGETDEEPQPGPSATPGLPAEEEPQEDVESPGGDASPAEESQ